MSSPLNKLADALPSFILQMQDIKMRQEAQEALSRYRQQMLNEKINAREALEDLRREMGYYEPSERPEVKVLRDSISSQYRTLSDPGSTDLLDDDILIKRWKKLQGDEADYFGKTEEHISLSTPVAVEGALSRQKEAEKPPVLAAPPKKTTKATIKSIQKGRSLLEAGLGATPTTEADATAQIIKAPEIPEGARAIETDKGWIYTLDEKVWISAETGEPIQ